MGQLLLLRKFLFDVGYDISEPLHIGDNPQVQRILLDMLEERCASLFGSYHLTLVLAGGRRLPIPRPFQHISVNYLECYVETYSPGVMLCQAAA